MGGIVNCKSCLEEVLSSWIFCPRCGIKLLNIPAPISEPPDSPVRRISDRFKELIEDYEHLTGSTLNESTIEDFLKHPAVGSLSVIDRERRLKSGTQIRQELKKGLFAINLQAWLDHIYDHPLKASAARVWITTKGDKYHLDRNCRGLISGQNYARFFGKDTYNPQFEEIHYAAFVLGKSPCIVCKPPTYTKPNKAGNQ